MKSQIIGTFVVAFIIVALEIPSLSYCGTRPFPRRPRLDFMDPVQSWFVKPCSNTAQDSSKADYYRVSSSQLQAEQEAQRRREEERAKLDSQRRREIEIIKNMQQQDIIDAENRKYELQQQQLLLQRLTPAIQPAPGNIIRPN
ncbi:MAG: hypothetical protein ACLQPD_26435 [Desulfomonilaceae bacterium]